MAAKKKSKVLLIGVDGADPTIIFDLARKGILPNFQNLMRAGSHGRLRSTVHTNTVPAWTSSITGVNPGKHGLYDIFLSFDLESKRIEYANSTRRKAKAIWEILSDSDKKVIILNVPATYPPEKVNGIIVSGMFTPSLKSPFTYPSSLKDELSDLKYQIDLGGTLLDLLLKRTSGKVRMLSLIRGLIRNRMETAKYLMKEFEWDLFMVVFVGLDRLQHWHWNFIDPNHVAYRKEEAQNIHENILNVYKEVDEAIGELMKLSGKYTNTIVYSDHGFRSVNRFFFTNNLLRREKILSAEKQQETSPIIGQEDVFRMIKRLNLDSLVNLMPNSLKRKVGVMIRPSLSFIDVFQLDLNRVKAFQFSNFIRINREIVDLPEQEIIAKRMINLFSRLDLGIRVFRREEVFSGPETRNIPPLLMLPERDVNPNQLLPIDGTLEMKYDTSLRIPSGSLMRCGDHSLWGIFLMTGPQINSATKALDLDIMDIAPTTLRLLDQNIPTSMDGNVSKSVAF